MRVAQLLLTTLLPTLEGVKKLNHFFRLRLKLLFKTNLLNETLTLSHWYAEFTYYLISNRGFNSRKATIRE